MGFFNSDSMKKMPNEFDNFARDVPVLEKNRLGMFVFIN